MIISIKLIAIFSIVVPGYYSVPIDKPSTDLLTPFAALPDPIGSHNGGGGGSDSGRLFNPAPQTGSKYQQKSGTSSAASVTLNSASKSSYSGHDGAAKILNQDQVIKGDGHYEYSFETDNGIVVHEVGDLKNIDGGTAENVQGSYSYTAPDGQLISIKYTADETGFHPVGDHIPTAPPIPIEIQRLLVYLEAHPEEN